MMGALRDLAVVRRVPCEKPQMTNDRRLQHLADRAIGPAIPRWYPARPLDGGVQDVR